VVWMLPLDNVIALDLSSFKNHRTDMFESILLVSGRNH
jgi:hypothetical protein